ncbi:urea transporter 2-like protein, partial [Lates japonicus]
MWMETKTEVEEASRSRASLSRRVLNTLLLCTGDMECLDEYMHDKSFVLQLGVWGLRGVTRVILANNPLSGALILAALYWASPWQGLLGTLGILVSTLTAVIMGQD